MMNNIAAILSIGYMFQYDTSVLNAGIRRLWLRFTVTNKVLSP